MIDRLQPEEVDALFRRYAETRRRADRNRLVEAHLGLAHHIARRFARRGIADDDLQQVAMLALVKAVERFDLDRGVPFANFAGRTIEGELKRHFRDAGWSVRVPRSAKELHLKVRRAAEELAVDLGRPPTARDIASHLDTTLDDVVAALSTAAAYSPAPLDPGGDDDRPASDSARLAVDDRALDDAPDRLLVEELLTSLPERDRTIVELRFFHDLTQTEIAEQVGVSQMHVSRLLRRSLTAMRGAAQSPR